MRLTALAVMLAWAVPVTAQTAPVTAEITARGETVPVGTANDDAADDPAIWRDPRAPERSLIVATDKKAGLYVYGLSGAVRSFTPAGRVNNVALADMGRAGVIVAASDRNDEARALIQLYRLDTVTGTLSRLGAVEGGAGEAYGLCLWREGRELNAYSVLKQGIIHHLRIALGAQPSGTMVRQMTLATQTEGCVVDRRSKTLYVGEEARGVWAFDARATGPVAGKLVVEADNSQLVPDVEGLAIVTRGRRAGWLIVSSQGDNAFALYSLPDYRALGRFRIAPGAFGSVEETDGIEVHSGSFGRNYPGGLFVAQDGHNAPAAQNFKLVAWRDILRAVQPAQED
ncbi:MAG: phytase [Rhodobacteraceae bacterium]|nr:phytase [Paracoccaceae bacterium]